MKQTTVAVASPAAHLKKMNLARKSRPILFLLASLTLLAPSYSAEVGALPATMEAPQPKQEPAEPKQSGPAVKPPARMPSAEVQCRERLTELDVTFEEHEPLKDEMGCSASYPVTVSRLSETVELRPPAVLTCAMAEASARFVHDHAGPLTRGALGSDLAAIEQVSAYVCRPRNGTKKLSEHAFANALDWGSLVLEDGTRIEVQAHGSAAPRRSRLVKAIQKAACGPFKTVLGPGSDADHADHFHFDLARRRGGGTWCQ